MDGFYRLQGFQKPLQKRHFARALLEQNGLRKARMDFLNTLLVNIHIYIDMKNTWPRSKMSQPSLYLLVHRFHP